MFTKIYSVQLYNSLSVLQNGVTDTINEHSTSSEATKNAAKEIMAVKARRQMMQYRDDERVKLARTVIQVAYLHRKLCQIKT